MPPVTPGGRGPPGWWRSTANDADPISTGRFCVGAVSLSFPQVPLFGVDGGAQKDVCPAWMRTSAAQPTGGAQLAGQGWGE